jgi:ribosome-associated protein
MPSSVACDARIMPQAARGSHAAHARPRCYIAVMQTIDFLLDRDHVELNQLLKLTGLCDSGGAGKALVASGAVSVDGAAELRKTCKIRAGQRVRLDDVEIHVIAQAT